MSAVVAIADAGELGRALWPVLERYAATSHGANPWTLDAARNALRIAHWVDAAVSAIGGSINSMYRSAPVNRSVGGAARSRHMEGLAVDIKPGPRYNARGAAAAIWQLVQSGELGAVQQVIAEPGWVHVGWRRAGEKGGPEYLSFDGKTYRRVG